MKILMLMMGLPASGKSTLCYNLLNTTNLQGCRISSDAIRLEYSILNYNSDSNKKVFDIVKERVVKASMDSDELIIVDATNLKSKYRKIFYDLAIEIGYDIVVCNCMTSVLDCIFRDSHRDSGFVGSKVIMDMDKYTQPIVNDGMIYKFDLAGNTDLFNKISNTVRSSRANDILLTPVFDNSKNFNEIKSRISNNMNALADSIQGDNYNVFCNHVAIGYN